MPCILYGLNYIYTAKRTRTKIGNSIDVFFDCLKKYIGFISMPIWRKKGVGQLSI